MSTFIAPTATTHEDATQIWRSLEIGLFGRVFRRKKKEKKNPLGRRPHRSQKINDRRFSRTVHDLEAALRKTNAITRQSTHTQSAPIGLSVSYIILLRNLPHVAQHNRERFLKLFFTRLAKSQSADEVRTILHHLFTMTSYVTSPKKGLRLPAEAAVLLAQKMPVWTRTHKRSDLGMLAAFVIQTILKRGLSFDQFGKIKKEIEKEQRELIALSDQDPSRLIGISSCRAADYQDVLSYLKDEAILAFNDDYTPAQHDEDTLIARIAEKTTFVTEPAAMRAALREGLEAIDDHALPLDYRFLDKKEEMIKSWPSKAQMEDRLFAEAEGDNLSTSEDLRKTVLALTKDTDFLFLVRPKGKAKSGGNATTTYALIVSLLQELRDTKEDIVKDPQKALDMAAFCLEGAAETRSDRLSGFYAQALTDIVDHEDLPLSLKGDLAIHAVRLVSSAIKHGKPHLALAALRLYEKTFPHLNHMTLSRDLDENDKEFFRNGLRHSLFATLHGTQQFIDQYYQIRLSLQKGPLDETREPFAVLERHLAAALVTTYRSIENLDLAWIQENIANAPHPHYRQETKRMIAIERTVMIKAAQNALQNHL